MKVSALAILQGHCLWANIWHLDDYAVLYNDCPYGIDGRIVHLVVWTKVSFASDAATGELTSEAQGQIEAFVRKRFLVNMEKPERVLWFKNPPALRSVHAIDHFQYVIFSCHCA